MPAKSAKEEFFNAEPAKDAEHHVSTAWAVATVVEPGIAGPLTTDRHR